MPAANVETETATLSLCERVRAVVPLIAKCSFEAERASQPVDQVIKALEATGVFKAFVPRRFGGYEIDLGTASAQALGPIGLDGVAFGATSVPEPDATALYGTATLLLAAVLRRRRL